MKKGKKAAALLLIICILCTAVPTEVFAATQTTAEMQADALHSLGLFSGTKMGYELHKPLTRMEAVTMTLHLTGEASTAEQGNYTHPFTDVPDWAQKYAGYAYEKGISSGVAPQLFGSETLCSEAEYLTFILRGLGYSDAAGEFSWNAPYALAKTVGLVDKETPANRFSRGDMVSVSFRALSAKLSPQSAVAVVDSLGYNILTFKELLLDKGIFTAEAYALAMEQYAKGPKQQKAVYLTFDDGPSAKVTPRVLNTLSAYGVPATFFMIGNMADKNPKLVQRAYLEGHKIATHGYSHNYKYLYADTANLLADIKKGNEALNKALGFNLDNKVFRFPGGSHGRKQIFKDAVTTNGYRYYDWNASGEDATKKAGSTAKEIAASTVATSVGHKGDIIVLFHDAAAKSTTADALPQIIEYYRGQGYAFRMLE